MQIRKGSDSFITRIHSQNRVQTFSFYYESLMIQKVFMGDCSNSDMSGKNELGNDNMCL